MAVLKKFSVYCNAEEDTFETEGYQENEPTQCPNCASTNIDSESITEVDRVASEDVNIKTSDIDVPIKDHDLADRTGKNVYKYATCYDVDASKDECHFLTSFADYLYLCGGGYQVLPKLFKSGVEFIQKPEHGDRVTFDLVDIDNILGYGKTASISKVARASNVVTVTTAAAHSFEVGELVHVDADDDTFDEMEIEVQSVADSTHFTYNQTGDDVAEKDATGDAGKIVVLAQFVPGDYIGPDSAWELVTPDGKLVPPGVFLRARITSNGSDDYHVYSWFNMRTYPG